MSSQCWASVPALIYLAAVPMWPRARRFGNVYAFATVDAIYAIFWFAAWVCLASYVAQGKSIGKSSSSDKDKDSNSKNSNKFRRATGTPSSDKSSDTTTSSSGSGCANWAYGNEAKCNISTATTIIGVVILYVDPFGPT
jgi:translocation protein SEC72